MRKHEEHLENDEPYSSPGGATTLEADEAEGGEDQASIETPEMQPPAIARGGGESLERYLREVSHWTLLSAEAERALSRRIAKGDRAALEEMISRNLRLVVYWAKRYGSSGMPIQDLIQEGNIGLMRAAVKFDHRKGTRFSTYASWWIRQALNRAICDRQDLIRIPVHMHQKMRIIDRVLESAGALASDDVDIEATVGKLGIVPFAEWQRTRRLQQSVSLDRRPDQDRDAPIEIEDHKTVSPMQAVHLRETGEQISGWLKELPPRHQAVLRLRFGLGGGEEHTLESIGSRMHISRERVRQIQAEAIEHIARRSGLPNPSPGNRMPRSLAKLRLHVLSWTKTRVVPATNRKPSPIARRAAVATVPGRSRRSG